MLRLNLSEINFFFNRKKTIIKQYVYWKIILPVLNIINYNIELYLYIKKFFLEKKEKKQMSLMQELLINCKKKKEDELIKCILNKYYELESIYYKRWDFSESFKFNNIDFLKFLIESVEKIDIEILDKEKYEDRINKYKRKLFIIK